MPVPISSQLLQEFVEGSNIASRARWIHTNPNIPEATAEDENGGLRPGHGTCMLDRAAGHLHGVAKKIDPIIVRIPTLRTAIEYYMQGLRHILYDLGDGKRSVLLMALYWPRYEAGGAFVFRGEDGSDGYDAVRKTMGDLLREITKKGVTVVTGSGNKGLVSTYSSTDVDLMFCRRRLIMSCSGLWTASLPPWAQLTQRIESTSSSSLALSTIEGTRCG